MTIVKWQLKKLIQKCSIFKYSVQEENFSNGRNVAHRLYANYSCSVKCPSVDETQLKQKLRFEKSLSKNACLLKSIKKLLNFNEIQTKRM